MSNSNDVHREDEVDWLDCISAIETSRGTVFFCDRDLLSLRKDLRVVGHFGENRKFMCGVVMYSITAYNPMNQQIEIVDNIQRNNLLMEEIRNKLPGCEILKNYSFFPSRPKHFERGFTVVVPLDYPITDHDGIVRALAVKYRQAAYFRCAIHNDSNVEQKLILMIDNQPKEVDEKLMVIERVNYHPAFMHHSNHSVFHDHRIALDILSRWRTCEAVEELLCIMSSFKNHDVLPVPINHEINPIIAIEGPKLKGLDSVCRWLSWSLQAEYLHSVPDCIRHLKKEFDAQPQLIRGAFYAVSNYILGQELYAHAKTSPVFIDRYWNSTVAHGIVNEVGEGTGNLPPKNHMIYEWPAYLPQPTTVVLVSCRKKLREIKNTGLKRGKATYQNMIFETFRRMKNQSWIEIDCAKNRCVNTTDVVSHIIDRLQARNVVTVKSPAKLCPSVTLHPEILHDTLQFDPSTTAINPLKADDPMAKFSFKSCCCPSVPPLTH